MRNRLFSLLLALSLLLGFVLEKRAPTVILPVLLAALVLPRSWFWVAWFWQMNNISLMGMALYMHRRLRRLPENIWIQDGGTVVTVYAPQDIGEMNRE